ncbi:MAG TPA: transcription initiation factor IIB [Nitrososphaera sp.]|nr:transcription initiation factor IIB [Nitrososphaera sp.]HEX2014381.1 transcription initiation factor IIB [Nitrososphaera sp.]
MVKQQTLRNLITDPETGELISVDSGQVVSENALSLEPEWRSFDAREAGERARTGVPTSLARHDMGLSTVIGRTDRDAGGNVIGSDMRFRMERLKKWDSRSQRHSPSERNLQHAFSMLVKIKERMGLPDSVIEKAAYIYRKAQERKLIRGRTIGSVLAASVYIASRQMGVLRTLDDVSASSDIKPKDVGRSYRLLVSEMELEVPMLDPTKYVVKVANNISIGERTKRKALAIIREAQRRGISVGKDPMGIAASVLYLAGQATGEPKTQSDIAKAAGVTEITVRNRSRELKTRLGLKLLAQASVAG